MKSSQRAAPASPHLALAWVLLDQATMDNRLPDDGKTPGECGFTSQTAQPRAPAAAGLAFRAHEAFEALRIEPFSSARELLAVTKPRDSGSRANERPVQ
eukprot:bmy_05365T0